MRVKFWCGMCEGKKFSIARNPCIEICHDYIPKGLPAEVTGKVAAALPSPVVGALALVTVMASPPEEDADRVLSEADDSPYGFWLYSFLDALLW